VAIGYYDLIFLNILRKNINFKKTATIGRQQLAINSTDICKILKTKNIYCGFSERLFLENFGSTQVDSYDISDYEGCSHIVDFSKKIKSNITTYDTILEFGNLEHIFNVSTAIENIQSMTKINGIIIHANPANSFCGHGFYQFSPEFFYSIYSEDNGFAKTRVFLVNYDSYKNKYFYEVLKPQNGNRVEFSSKHCLGNYVVTKKIKKVEKKFFYQSDYLYHWKNKNNKSKNNRVMKDGGQRSAIRILCVTILKKIPFLFNVLQYLNYRRHLLFVAQTRSYNKHPSVIKVNIDKLKILL